MRFAVPHSTPFFTSNTTHSFIQRVDSSVPLGYRSPEWPSLYWPLPIGTSQPYYLYFASDIWRFTLYWTLLFFGAMHLVVAGWACIVQWRNWKLIWVVPVVYAAIGGLEALVAGSIVGGLLGAVYQAGYFKMSTWIPFVWAFINALVLILSSFAIHGGL
ncbi:integral membrane protein [Amniculicola lignicola CBS 123094]|uniref:Integral membrane protein n=1 Tax=Amniculicola lignicola CBS 123094 TaxID=1392246 RepID=A0A6A5W7Q5_9PLEO|nr:integral membrane protein [Amniculicola lignicola CBS 123094]